MSKRATNSSWPPVSSSGVMEVLLWALRRRKRFRVDGTSMTPTLNDGQHVLARPVTRAEPMDIVICRHPFMKDHVLIKRVTEVSEDGMVLAGDNPQASTDSQSFGRVPWVHLRATVTSKM